MSNVCSLEETLLKRPASPIGIDFFIFLVFCFLPKREPQECVQRMPTMME